MGDPQAPLSLPDRLQGSATGSENEYIAGAISLEKKIKNRNRQWKLKSNIQVPMVQQVRGSLGAHEQGLTITTRYFSAGAIKEMAQPYNTPIAQMNGTIL